MIDPITLPMLVTLAILNATIPAQHIPIDVTVTPLSSVAVASGSSASEADPGTATPSLAFDAATLTALATVAGGAYAAFRKSSSRANASADTTLKVADSLKATDYGAAENASIMAEALSELSTVSPEIAKAISKSNARARENAIKWHQDNKEYYENLPTAPRKGELEKDPVKTKLAQVNKVTEKTPDP